MGGFHMTNSPNKVKLYRFIKYIFQLQVEVVQTNKYLVFLFMVNRIVYAPKHI